MPHDDSPVSKQRISRFLRSEWDGNEGILVEADLGQGSASVTIANARLSGQHAGLRSVSSDGPIQVDDLPPGARQRLATRLRHVLGGEVTSVRVAVLSAVLPSD